jgi:hypothetical protein
MVFKCSRTKQHRAQFHTALQSCNRHPPGRMVDALVSEVSTPEAEHAAYVAFLELTNGKGVAMHTMAKLMEPLLAMLISIFQEHDYYSARRFSRPHRAADGPVGSPASTGVAIPLQTEVVQGGRPAAD